MRELFAHSYVWYGRRREAPTAKGRTVSWSSKASRGGREPSAGNLPAHRRSAHPLQGLGAAIPERRRARRVHDQSRTTASAPGCGGSRSVHLASLLPPAHQPESERKSDGG